MTRPFIHADFLLDSARAANLYRGFAADAPVTDWHSHLPAALIASNHRFASLTEAWPASEHYNWRAMPTSGIAERLISDDAAIVQNGYGSGSYGRSAGVIFGDHIVFDVLVDDPF